MNSSQTRWLLGLALALFVVIVADELRRPAASGKPVAEALVPQLRPASVTCVEFTRSNATLRAERVAGQWRLTSPLAYPANDLALNALLDVCSRLKPQLVIGSPQARSPADFGLAPPQATALFLQGGAPVELRIGSRTPVNNQLYVQVAGTTHIAVTDENLLELLPKSADDWRDRRLLSLAGVKFDRLRIRTGPRDLLLQRNATNQLWRITQPAPDKRGNTPLIEQLLQDLQHWPVQRFVADDPKADLETFGLQTPDAELAFGSGTNDTLVVQFGKSPTNQPDRVYSRLPTTTNVVLMARDRLEGLRAPVWEFTEHRLLDALPADAVDTIELRGRENFTLRLQTKSATNQVWVADDKFQTVTDPHLMSNFLANLITLEAVELAKDVVTDYAPYGLAPPGRSISLLKSATNSLGSLTNHLVARLDFGDSASLPVDRVFARRQDESSVYVVPRGDLNRLAWSLFQIQDRTVWNFGSNQVAAVTVEFDGRSRRLTRAPGGQWLEGSEAVDPLRNVALEETLFRLGHLRAEQWVHLGADGLPVRGIGESSHRVRIELTGPPAQTNTVTFGFVPRGRNAWAAITDARTGQPLVFEFPRSLYYDYVVQYLGPPK
ncbi:MAG: DUF4340 domain-containing protein [Limisphaerales bacterium]